MSKAKEISALYKDIKQQMGKLVSLCHEVEDHAEATEAHAEVTADAYQRGYETAKHECEDCPKQAYTDALKMETYQKGLSDAWEAARKIGSNSMCSLEEMGFDFSQCVIPDYNPSWFVVKNCSASECIEKIRKYEQENLFCVGDEFETESGTRFVIVKMDGKEVDRYIDEYGTTYCMIAKYQVMRKTGRHFPEIATVLEKMREESNG